MNDDGHSDNQHSLLFYATFKVRYEIFLLHFLTQKHFFRQIKLMTTPMKGSVPYTGKAGPLIFVSCDVTHRDTGRPAENTENGRCVRAVWDNLKSRLLITDLSNNRSFGREGSLNRVSFSFIRRTFSFKTLRVEVLNPFTINYYMLVFWYSAP